MVAWGGAGERGGADGMRVVSVKLSKQHGSLGTYRFFLENKQTCMVECVRVSVRR